MCCVDLLCVGRTEQVSDPSWCMLCGALNQAVLYVVLLFVGVCLVCGRLSAQRFYRYRWALFAISVLVLLLLHEAAFCCLLGWTVSRMNVFVGWWHVFGCWTSAWVCWNRESLGWGICTNSLENLSCNASARNIPREIPATPQRACSSKGREIARNWSLLTRRRRRTAPGRTCGRRADTQRQ